MELKPACLRVHLKRDKFTPRAQRLHTAISTEEGEEGESTHLLSTQLSIDPELGLMVVVEEEEEEEAGLGVEGAEVDGGPSMETNLI